MQKLIGQSLGRYHVLEKIGEGGMATVYKAYDTRLEHEVAVKVIRIDDLPRNAEERTLKRFEREAKALAKLDHPNIVKVMDYGEYKGRPFLVMPYLPGGTLKQYLKNKGLLDWREAVSLLLPITKALACAHAEGVIHRDVKPSNILLTVSGEPMLTDFGVAKVIDEEVTQDLTGTSATVGTPEYMAPEQVISKTVDHRADIYALGVVFFEMVTGRRPYEADTPMAVLFKHASDPLPRPKDLIPDLPEQVEQVLLKALAKKPADRYKDMGSLVIAFERLKQSSVQTDSSPTTLLNELLSEIVPIKTTNQKKKDAIKRPDKISSTYYMPKERKKPYKKSGIKATEINSGIPTHSKRITGVILVTIIGILSLIIFKITTERFNYSDSELNIKAEISPDTSVSSTIPTKLPETMIPIPTTAETTHDLVLTSMFYAPYPPNAINRVGKGSVIALNYIESSNQLIVVSKTGVYKYNPDDYSIIEYYPLPENIDKITVSESGGLLAFVNSMGNIEVMNLAIGETKTLNNIDGYYSYMNFSHDDKFFVLRTEMDTESVVQIWDVNSAEMIWSNAIGKSGSVVAISNNAGILATSDKYNNLLLCDLSTNMIVKAEGHSSTSYGNITNIVFSMDSKVIVSSDLEGQVILSDTESGNLIKKLNTNIITIEFSDADKKMIGKSSHQIAVWEFANNSYDIQEVYYIDFLSGSFSSPVSSGSIDYYHEQLLFDYGTYYNENGIVTYDYIDSRKINTSVDFSKIISKDFLANPILIRYGQKEIALVDHDSGEVIQTSSLNLNTSTNLYEAILSPDQKLIALTTSYWVYPVCSAKLILLDAKTLEVENSFSFDCGLGELAFSPDGNYLSVNYDYEKILILHDDMNKQFIISEYSEKVEFFNQSLKIASMRDSTIDIYNIEDGKYLGGINCGSESLSPIVTFTLSSNDQYLACALKDSNLYVWDLENSEAYKSYEINGSISALSFSPQNEYLAIGIDNSNLSYKRNKVENELRVINISNGSIVFSENIGNNLIRSLRFDDAGNILISETYDNTYTSWDIS